MIINLNPKDRENCILFLFKLYLYIVIIFYLEKKNKVKFTQLSCILIELEYTQLIFEASVEGSILCYGNFYLLNDYVIN